jgi:UDP:flavonoid glycosyltransferase YjiC (YdhE family)
MVTSVGLTGHALPALALARELRAHGHDVLVETSESWRRVADDLGLGFAAAPEEILPPGSDGGGPGLAEAAGSVAPAIAEFGPDVLISDLFTLAPALAAEVAGIPRASLIHHPYPVSPPGRPPFPSGLLRPRTPLGAGAWRLVRPSLDPRHRKGRAELNEVRAQLGLPPQRRFFGSISDGLALVATFPQLEYPRRWPAHVHVTGPLVMELPRPRVELPEGEGPLVLVVASSAQDPELRLVRVALEALAREPVRVLATTSGTRGPRPDPVTENAAVVDWMPFDQVMADTSLVVTNGGHGTIASALAGGVPVLVCPAGADQPENGVRVSWAGAGLMLPWTLMRPGSLRSAVRRLLSEQRFTSRAAAIGRWSTENDGAALAASLVERYAVR